ncbi:Zinc finger BED domain-containing protein DAYSLEEPER [Fusarium oxysporum f. sp. albedinis]|nr:Zinc finger BED domain-containing protein DAYSLEEPER [Fusarium oxysporum f. sp. albedinis]
MPEDFVLFKQLPPELRTRIWRYALPPASPGVHFFRLLNAGKARVNRYGILLSNWPKDHYLMPPTWPVSPFPNTSSDSRKEMESHLVDNPSSYVTGLNLRKTCRESRYAACLEERQRRSGACALLRNIHTFCALQMTSLSFSFNLSNQRPLTPSNNRPDAGLGKWGLGMRHIGWEYHADWFSNRRICPSTDILNFLCSCALQGARAGNLETIWIVNYNIKRKQWVPSTKTTNAKADMHVFKMDKYRLVEVDYKDWRRLSREEATWEEVSENPEEDATNTFLPFVNFLQGLISLLIGHRQALRPHPVRVGILACETY